MGGGSCSRSCCDCDPYAGHLLLLLQGVYPLWNLLVVKQVKEDEGGEVVPSAPHKETTWETHPHSVLGRSSPSFFFFFLSSLYWIIDNIWLIVFESNGPCFCPRQSYFRTLSVCLYLSKKNWWIVALRRSVPTRMGESRTRVREMAAKLDEAERERERWELVRKKREVYFMVVL